MVYLMTPKPISLIPSNENEYPYERDTRKSVLNVRIESQIPT